MNIEEFLASKGFKRGHQHGDIIATQEYYKALKGDNIPHCECNEKPPVLCVSVHEGKVGQDDRSSVSTNIRGEVNNTWASVGAYAMSPEEFMDKFEQVIEATTMCWGAFYIFMREQ
jgi:hypothetical protein